MDCKSSLGLGLQCKLYIHVGCGVDKPGEVEDSDISEDRDEVGGDNILAPEGGDQGGQKEGADQEALEIVTVLGHDQRVGLEVSHGDGAPSPGHSRVLPNTQPAHVREKESPL
mgnify:CR=1 FL=1